MIGCFSASYARFSRSAFNASPQAMTWSNIALTDFSCWEAGLTILLGRERRHGGKAKIIGFLLLPIVLMSWRNQRGSGHEKNSALLFVRFTLR
jgi:hypothetical protein